MFTFPVAHFGGGLDFTIDQAIRFNDDDSAYLSRTPGGAGNRRTFTFSCWVKRGNLTGANQPIFSAGGDDWLMFLSAETLGFNTDGTGNYRIVTSQLFRDPGAWFHLVLRVDTTNSTAGDRLRLYINGSEVTSFGTDTNPTLNLDTAFNNTGEHNIGKLVGASQYFDGYLAEIHHVDGSSLGPDTFGKTSSDTGQWVPKKVSGVSYGTTGFHVNGADSSDLGEDQAGSNDWTSNNLAAADSVLDSPTDNFAVWNPLIPLTSGNFSDGNLEFTVPGSSTSQHAKSTISFTSGEKKVCEMQIVSGSSITLGICDEDFVADANGFSGDSRGYFDTNGNKVDKDGNSSSYGASFSSSNVIRIEVDLSSNPGTIEFFRDGVSQGDAFTDIDSTKTWFFWCRCKVDAVKANFGQLGFAGTPTANFTALSTGNIPDPTVANPANYFDTKLWTGNDTDGRAISGYKFQPDWVWIKSRSGAYSHSITDAVRGAGPYIQSNTADAEASGPGAFGSTLAFTSDGFTLDNGTSDNLYVNAGSETYVGWAWKANGSGSSNTDGSITSTVSADTTSGFSIVSYTGTGSNATVGHGLGVAPSMVICKQRNASRSWVVYHEGLTSAANVIYLDLTSAQASDSTVWNSTDPTSTVFSVGSANGSNSSGNGMIAYCFAEVEGFSKFGSFTGNGSGDGPFVATSFAPAFLLIKNRSTAGTNWDILDSTREPFNSVGNQLFANRSDAEASNDHECDFLSNGFKVRDSSGSINGSGATHIYMAFAESPFKHATAR